MKRQLPLPAVLALIVTGSCSRSSDLAQNGGDLRQVVALAPDQLPWQKIDRGTLMAVLRGDPSKAGYYFVRYKLPPRWEAPPHLHTNPLVVTIQSGTMYIAYGDDLTRRTAKAFGPGSFIAFPAGTKMLEFTQEEEAIIDLQGPGPLLTRSLSPKGT